MPDAIHIVILAIAAIVITALLAIGTLGAAGLLPTRDRT